MDADDDRSIEQLLTRRLRNVAPAKVRAFDSSGEAREIGVPERRRKWAAVIEAVQAMPWVKLELLDKKGAVLGYIEHPDADDDQGDERGAVDDSREARMLGLMLEAQRVVLSSRTKEHQELLVAMTEVLRAQAQAARELTAIYQAQVQSAMSVAQMRAELQQSDGLDAFIKALPELTEHGPKLAGLLSVLRGGNQLPAPKPTPKAPSPSEPTKNGVS